MLDEEGEAHVAEEMLRAFESADHFVGVPGDQTFHLPIRTAEADLVSFEAAEIKLFTNWRITAGPQ